MTIHIDIQSIEEMRNTFLETGDAEFTHIETGMINGHQVEVSSEDQRRVNSDFVKNLTDILFAQDKSEGMMSTKNTLMHDVAYMVTNELATSAPLKGKQIAQVLGKAIEIIENAAKLRENVSNYVREQLTAKHCPDVADLASIDLGLPYDVAQRAIDSERDPEKKESAWKAAIDKLTQKFIAATNNINGTQELNSGAKTILKRLAFNNREFAEPEYFDIAKAAFKNIDISNMKEVLLNPDEFQDEDRVRVLMNFGSQIAEVFNNVHKNVELATRDLELVMQLTLAMLASSEPKLETYLMTQSADIEKLHEVSENISGQVQKNLRRKDGLSETLYANRGLGVLTNLSILAKGYRKAADAINQGYRDDFKRASRLTDAQCAKLDTDRIENYLSRATDKADRARIWKLFLEDVEGGFKVLRETPVLCQASKDVMANVILEKPDLYESGALFIAPLSLESELPTQDLIQAFRGQTSVDVLKGVAHFGKSMNDAFLKLNLRENIDVNAEGAELSTLMLMHILANRHEALARIIIDEDNYLDRLNTMLDGLYKESTVTEEAALYTNAKAILTAMLAVKEQVGSGLQEKFAASS